MKNIIFTLLFLFLFLSSQSYSVKTDFVSPKFSQTQQIIPQIILLSSPSDAPACTNQKCVNFKDYYDGEININFDAASKNLLINFYGLKLDEGNLGENIENAPIVLKLTYTDDSNNRQSKYMTGTTDKNGSVSFSLGKIISKMDGVLTIRALYCYNYTDADALVICNQLLGVKNKRSWWGDLNSNPQQKQTPSKVKIAFSDYYYTKPFGGLSAPLFCLPVAIVLALVMAGMHAIGKNPLAMFDLSTPHMSNVYSQYNVRGVSTYGVSGASVIRNFANTVATAANSSKVGSGVSGMGGFKSAVGAVTGVNINRIGQAIGTAKVISAKGMKAGLGISESITGTMIAKTILARIPLVGGIIVSSLNAADNKDAEGRSLNYSKGMKATLILSSILQVTSITAPLGSLTKTIAIVIMTGTLEENITRIEEDNVKLAGAEKKLADLKADDDKLNASLSKSKDGLKTATLIVEKENQIKDQKELIANIKNEIIRSAQKMAILTYGTQGSGVWSIAAQMGSKEVIAINNEGVVNGDGSVNIDALATHVDQLKMGGTTYLPKGYTQNVAKQNENLVVQIYAAYANPTIASAIHNYANKARGVSPIDQNGKPTKAFVGTVAETTISNMVSEDSSKFNKSISKLKVKDTDPVKDSLSVSSVPVLRDLGIKQHTIDNLISKHKNDTSKYTYKKLKEDIHKLISSAIHDNFYDKRGELLKTAESTVIKDITSAMNGPSLGNNPYYISVPGGVGGGENIGLFKH